MAGGAGTYVRSHGHASGTRGGGSRGASCPPATVRRYSSGGGTAATAAARAPRRGRPGPPHRRTYQREHSWTVGTGGWERERGLAAHKRSASVGGRGLRHPGTKAEALTSQAAAFLGPRPAPGPMAPHHVLRAAPADRSDRAAAAAAAITVSGRHGLQIVDDVSALTPNTPLAPPGPPGRVRPGLGGIYFGAAGDAAGDRAAAPAAPPPPAEHDAPPDARRLSTYEYDDRGRCVRHPHVRLRKRKMFGRGWKVLMSACPGEFEPFFTPRKKVVD